MGLKEMKLPQGISNYKIEVLSAGVKVTGDNVKAPYVQYSGEFNIKDNGRQVSIAEKGNSNFMGNSRFFNSGNVGIFGSNLIIVNGQVISGNANVVTNIGGEPSYAEVIVPKKTKPFINMTGKSSDLTVSNLILEQLHAKTMSGDISLQELDMIIGKIKTMSGDIDATILESILNYQISMKTISGKTRQQSNETTAPKIYPKKHVLDLETISGDINLLFKGQERTV